MLEFDIDTWCARQCYVTLAQTTSVAFGFVHSMIASTNDIDKLQQIQSIGKGNGLNFD